MTRETVTRMIDRLDAISRSRALEPGETIQLEKMIRTEQRYAYLRAHSRAHPKKAGAPAAADAPTPNSETPAPEAGESEPAARSDLARGTTLTGTGD